MSYVSAAVPDSFTKDGKFGELLCMTGMPSK